MKKILLVILIITTTSCINDRKRKCYVCDVKQKEKVAEFVSDNIQKANNMSDEEMEDVIIELNNTAIKLYCEQEFLMFKSNGDLDYDSIEKEKGKSYFPYIY